MKHDFEDTWSSPVRLAVGVAAHVCALLAPAQAQSLLTTNGKFFAWPDTEAPGLPGVYFAGNVDFVDARRRRNPRVSRRPVRRRHVGHQQPRSLHRGAARRPCRCWLAGTTRRRDFRASR